MCGRYMPWHSTAAHVGAIDDDASSVRLRTSRNRALASSYLLSPSMAVLATPSLRMPLQKRRFMGRGHDTGVNAALHFSSITRFIFIAGRRRPIVIYGAAAGTTRARLQYARRVDDSGIHAARLTTASCGAYSRAIIRKARMPSAHIGKCRLFGRD